MNLLLTGFMGAGKSTIGRLLARRLGYYFLDTDTEIERQQSCTVADIFQYADETRFRDLETELLEELQSVRNTIIATGGGMVVREQNRELMKSLGKCVYLRVPPAHLIGRLSRDKHRPLMRQGDETPEQRVTRLLEEREPIYMEAEMVIDTGHFTPAQTVTEIIRNL